MVAASQKRKFVCIAPPARQGPPVQEETAAPAAPAAVPAAARRSTPSASALIIAEKKATGVRTSQPRSAPVICCVFKVGDCAQDLWAAAKPDAALYQVQLVHNCKPSLLFAFVGSFNEYLKAAHDEDVLHPAGGATAPLRAGLVHFQGAVSAPE